MAAIVTTAQETVVITVTGVRHLGLPGPIAPEDRFQIGSNTKAMTATMLALLIEQGKLSWKTRPVDVFPEWKDLQPDYQRITLTDLLSHRAGLCSYTDDGSPEWADVKTLAGKPAEMAIEFAHHVLRRKPAAPPGTKFIYSNAGFAVAAAMAEKVTGESWDALMRTRLFDPLGITVSFGWPASDDPNQPWGHRETKDGVRPHDPHDSYQFSRVLWPAGGVCMNAADYAKFMRLHLQGLAGHDGLLKAETIRHLHAPVGPADPAMGDFFAQYALGWGVGQVAGAPASVHTGSAGTFVVVMALWPSRDLAVAVFANAGGSHTGGDAVNEVLTQIGQHPPTLAARAPAANDAVSK